MSDWRKPGADHLISEIRRLFENAKIPIEVAKSGIDPDRDALIETFKKRPWHSVTLEEISFHRNDLVFFSLAGLIYYLPAFMTHILINPDEVDTAIDSTCSTLAPACLEEVFGSSSTVVLRRMLSLEQRRVICQFLEFVEGSFPGTVDPQTFGYWSR
jgi:hypothetical protein